MVSKLEMTGVSRREYERSDGCLVLMYDDMPLKSNLVVFQKVVESGVFYQLGIDLELGSTIHLGLCSNVKHKIYIDGHFEATMLE